MDVITPTPGATGRQDWIGLRVARWRDILGWSQERLAAESGKNRTQISRWETGQQPVDKWSTITALADALGVGVDDLTGQPIRPITAAERGSYVLAPAIRRALDDIDETTRPRPIDQLEDLTDQAMRARMAGKLADVAVLMPAALAESRVLAESGDHRAVVLHARALVYSALVTRFLGFVDLGARLADRAMVLARSVDDVECQGAAAYALATTAFMAGVPRRAVQIADRAAAMVPDWVESDGALGISVMCHLAAAQALASLGRSDDAVARWNEAAGRVRHVHTDPWRLETTPASVDTWRVAIALENGEPERAPDYARRVDRSALRTADRVGRLYFDVARGQFVAGDYERCVASMLTANDAYPLMLWAQPLAQELVGWMARESRVRGGSAALRDLCLAVGVDPLLPSDNT